MKVGRAIDKLRERLLRARERSRRLEPELREFTRMVAQVIGARLVQDVNDKITLAMALEVLLRGHHDLANGMLASYAHRHALQVAFEARYDAWIAERDREVFG